MSEVNSAMHGISDEIAAAMAVCKKHQTEQRLFQSTNSLPERIESVVSQYKHNATQALQASKEFRDRMIIDLRAISLVLTMVGNASTHREKDARLRGSIEIIEGAIERLERQQFDISFAQGPHFEDVFRSDYPTRHYVEKIRELQAQIESLTKTPPSSDSPTECADPVF
jgi:hypothetical protein